MSIRIVHTIAAAIGLAFSAAALAQATSYEVLKGDTLSAVARKTRHEGLSANQMLVAIYRANQSDFPDGRIHALRVGQVLSMPDRAQAAALGTAQARREVRSLYSRPVLPALALASASPASGTPAQRYEEGLRFERARDDQGALQSFLAAAGGGHGLAQKKLGEIYDKGNAAVERDYQASLKWYEKAREQGVALQKPLARP